ncbi:putative alpha/beta hydrolase [Aspergillus clavatus NRRL 1]|uniref:Alpha/beta hydrolase, putative n=1 Tax=Aspergillus clavatus (strain ATCC 1007 / CBS 513.65 / DSM 816 / NCTC 3887 / NRRL 1 / QM 1276 / 107) TaxID=344612 RepID=A1CU39_ASPCL|nr:alpha/beta hydrolase, putative [Aspergillus clavatus NRRL 1]EAW06826.1 alpha/beta hydrolase, putative [Aspergillus clavatus NRRL 1]
MATPGLLYVTMHPRPSLPAAQFHDWYNTEHGPLRLRLPFVTNGFRYRATDGLEPEWVALYDITDMVELTRETYLALRCDGIKTPREKATMAQIAVDRRLYDLVDDQKVPDYRPLENETDAASAGSVLIAVSVKVPADQEEELNRWYDEEHIAMLSRVPGWRRSRRFVTAAIDPNAPREYISLHEYAPKNGLEGPEHNAAKSTPWSKRISEIAIEKKRRVYQWVYTFGPAPRELSSLASKDVVGPWNSNDNRTRTLPSEARPAVESFVTTEDGVAIPYRLEGSTDPNAPVIVLSNSILVDWSVWDGFVNAFLSDAKNQNYRILRYLTRGRLRECGEKPINIDVLASDIIALLDALRIPQATLIGVSLGGVTVLNTSLLYPDRVTRFISCDTNSSAPESNRKAWGDRHAMAQSEGAVSPTTQEPIIGEQLAEVTTRRWFVPETYETQPEVAAKVKEVVRNNSLEGFQKGMQALCAYDVRERMANATVPGLFVAGEGDGILPQTMQKMASDLKGGAELKIIPKAGHLPMVEQPQAFTEVVNEFLRA